MNRSYFKVILISTLFVTLFACVDNQGTEISEEEVLMSEHLTEKFLNTELLVYNSDTLLASTEVLSFYKENAFSPLWTNTSDLTEKGDTLLHLIGNAYDYGLLPEMFHFNFINKLVDSSLVDAEVLLTNAYYLFATHIEFGCIDSISKNYVWKKDSLNYSISEELNKIKSGAYLKPTVLAHQPEVWDYEQLQSGLASFLDSFAIDTNRFEIPAFKEDSLLCYAAANKALEGHHFLDSTNLENDSIFIERLKYFQLTNGLKDDAIVGKWTGRALAKSNKDRFLQAALALEKWRWKKPYPSKYIRVNIPEFALFFVDSNEIKRKHRVVVGAYTTQTPEFQAEMRRFVTNPFWNVPYSISSTEILANARKDSAYLVKRGYKIFREGAQIDPKEIDWSSVKQNNFPYKVRQDGGGSNSLGKVKFLFPNVHSIYIHDTPSKRLFANDVRAYSHGCVRLHQPFELAKALLTADNHRIEYDTLTSLVNRGIQRVVELKEPFPVYIEYITAAGDSSGMIRFLPDIYGRDEKFLVNSFKTFEF